MPAIFGAPVQANNTIEGPRLPAGEYRQRPPFRYLVHPDKWEYDPKAKAFVPSLAMMVKSGGVGGVALTSNGQEDDSIARGNYSKRGFIILETPDSRFADVLPGGQYLSSHACKGTARKAYTAVWEGYERVGNTVIWSVNEEQRQAFLSTLIAAGVIPPMRDIVRQVLLQDMEARVRRAENKLTQSNAVSLQTRAQRMRQLLEEMREATYIGAPKKAKPGRKPAAQDEAGEA